MDNPEILDALFREAVSAIDAGDVATLERLLAIQPRLVRDRLDAPGAWLRDKVGGALDGFFRQPYLLWFVAEDPVRNDRLPRNIALVARALIQAAQREGVDNLQEQLDYALRLVAWSWVARLCDVQIELIDVLVGAGAALEGSADAAIFNGNYAAAEHLLERGAPLTLSTALLLERWEDVARLAGTASARAKQNALVLAALHGKVEALRRMLDLGVDVNACSTDIYSHATPLHHAVCSGSLDAVKVLVEAGAELGTRDKAENATPLGWAEYYRREKRRVDDVKRYAEIAAYLRGVGGDEKTDTVPTLSLEQYEALAKDVVDVYRSGDAAAIQRIKDHFQLEPTLTGEQVRAGVRERLGRQSDSENASADLALVDAQLLVARAHGFESWPELAKHIEGRS
jgi:Ankyrin repeats (3 copies)